MMFVFIFSFYKIKFPIMSTVRDIYTIQEKKKLQKSMAEALRE